MRKEMAQAIFSAQKSIRNPYFQKDIILNSEGFHHLKFSAQTERNKREQLLKFSLLPLGLEIIKKSGTIQEYRKILTPIGKRSSRDGSITMKEIEYWGLVAIIGEKMMINEYKNTTLGWYFWYACLRLRYPIAEQGLRPQSYLNGSILKKKYKQN